MTLHELIAGLYSFIKSINYTEILEKVWIRSSKPYPISLSLRKLQGLLKDDLPMDRDCFNLIVRKIMLDDIQTSQKTKQLIAKHYLDMKFWMTTDFGRHPDFRKKLDVEQLANSVRSWPGIKYNVSTCKSIHIPVQCIDEFILFTLDQDTRTVYILDPTPINPMYRYNPLAKYVKKIIWISEHLPKAMSKACPGSRWNEDILLWH
uniref:Ubiquitin-like protease family profile domain-containing protein n=2 Tax=Aegilops tauschii subsp. strangulata TaxID=200361 RepID=A0A453IIE7_AEGTS